MDPYKIILRPVVTEKSYAQSRGRAWGKKDSPLRWYSFEVAVNANKHQIRNAVEQLFDVKVEAVNTCHMRPKYKRVRAQPGLTKRWKKAMVRVSPESKGIEGF
jgi:large subunit ribosomal protein L23